MLGGCIATDSNGTVFVLELSVVTSNVAYAWLQRVNTQHSEGSHGPAAYKRNGGVASLEACLLTSCCLLRAVLCRAACCAGTQAVAQGMAHFFTNMSLDLQGKHHHQVGGTL